MQEAAQVQTREFAQLVVDGTLSLMAALDDVVLPEDLAQPCACVFTLAGSGCGPVCGSGCGPMS